MVDPVLAAEAAWLNADSAVTAALGTGQPILPYARRTTSGVRSVWLLRRQVVERRLGYPLKRQEHLLQVHVDWPADQQDPAAVQGALDTLVDAVVVRVRGGLQDKTHGGAFYSVGEENATPTITVTFGDPVGALTAGRPLTADVTYWAITAPFIA